MELIPGFRIEQRAEPDGAVRVCVAGELDLAVAPALSLQLERLKGTLKVVRLDLSAVTFMDSMGLGTVLGAALDARRDGWELEICGPLTRPVHRVIEISGAGPYLWPDNGH